MSSYASKKKLLECYYINLTKMVIHMNVNPI